MANNFTVSGASKALALNAALDVLNGGSVKIYSGSQPASPDAGIGGATLLVSCPLNATAFAAAVAGTGAATKTANAITNGTAGASGTAAWFRMFKSDGTTAVCDGTVGTGSTDLVLPTTAIVSSETVSVASCVVSQ